MNLARPRHRMHVIGQCLHEVKQPFTYHDLTTFMKEHHISYPLMRKYLHQLEKADVLVRLSHGVYMTMAAYTAQNGSSSYA